MAAEGKPAVQMMLPLGEMLGWLRKGVGELIRQAGLQVMELLMQEEVRELVGERNQQWPERTAHPTDWRRARSASISSKRAGPSSKR